MTARQWVTARQTAGLTQVQAARALTISQPYLSQLENGIRIAPPTLLQKAIDLYNVSPTAFPLPDAAQFTAVAPSRIERDLASLGYPPFAHVRSAHRHNPAAVVFNAIIQPDLDTRLVEALPWVLMQFPDLNWSWLRDNAKLHNAQNRLGYVIHLAKESAAKTGHRRQIQTLISWESDLEEARLAREGTLCRDSMPAREREWLKVHRPAAAKHWKILTSLTSEQLPYAA